MPHILETTLLEYTLFDEADLVTCGADVEVLQDGGVGDNVGTCFFHAGEDDDADIRLPPFELTSPVLQGGFPDKNKMGPGGLMVGKK